MFNFFRRTSYLTNCRGSKLALLHRVKERKPLSLSDYASVTLFSLKVAWSGKSLIVPFPVHVKYSLSMSTERRPLWDLSKTLREDHDSSRRFCSCFLQVARADSIFFMRGTASTSSRTGSLAICPEVWRR